MISNVIPINIKMLRAQDESNRMARIMALMDYAKDIDNNQYPPRSEEFDAYAAKIIKLKEAKK